SPSVPKKFQPQHFAAPPAVTAQACWTPVATDATPDERPVTSTGTALSEVVASPRLPTWFQPQHLRPVEPVTAHPKRLPADTASTPAPRPATSTGTLIGVTPSPSSPTLLIPQHQRSPPLVSAQVSPLPELIAATPLSRPKTSTGTSRDVRVPS